MTKNEFKAWFQGFSEGIEGQPTEAQWQRVCERVNEIDGKETTYPVFIDRYVEPYRRYLQYPYLAYGNVSQAGLGTLQNTAMNVMTMADAGRAEFKALSQA